MLGNVFKNEKKTEMFTYYIIMNSEGMYDDVFV